MQFYSHLMELINGTSVHISILLMPILSIHENVARNMVIYI